MVAGADLRHGNDYMLPTKEPVPLAFGPRFAHQPVHSPSSRRAGRYSGYTCFPFFNRQMAVETGGVQRAVLSRLRVCFPRRRLDDDPAKMRPAVNIGPHNVFNLACVGTRTVHDYRKDCSYPVLTPRRMRVSGVLDWSTQYGECYAVTRVFANQPFIGSLCLCHSLWCIGQSHLTKSGLL